MSAQDQTPTTTEKGDKLPQIKSCQTEGERVVEMCCYGALLILTVISYFNQKIIPLHVSLTIHALAIIYIGSFRSL